MAGFTNFGGVYSNRDLNLIQQSVEIEPAEPRLNLVEIPGSDGSRDLSTQPAGRVTFNDRKITWTFALYPGDNWDATHRRVSNHLNGLECNITLGTMLDYYFRGRLAVRKYNIDGLLRQIVVEATCRPYALKQQPTKVTKALTTTYNSIALNNDRMPTVPTITVTKETSIKFGSLETTVAAGTHKILGIQLAWGSNTLQAKVTSGTGNITIEYQEGSL